MLRKEAINLITAESEQLKSQAGGYVRKAFNILFMLKRRE